MGGIELPAALVLLLRGICARGLAERDRLQCRLALDLPAHVPDNPAQAAAQDAQLLLTPPGLKPPILAISNAAESEKTESRSIHGRLTEDFDLRGF
jgi:hypothetical protein